MVRKTEYGGYSLQDAPAPAIAEAKIARASDGGDLCGGISCAVPGVVLGLVGAGVGAGFGYALGSSKGSSIFFSFDPQPKP